MPVARGSALQVSCRHRLRSEASDIAIAAQSHPLILDFQPGVRLHLTPFEQQEDELAVDHIVIEGISGREQISLREEISANDLVISPQVMSGPRAGEPITIGILIAGKLALLGLSAFLLKRRRNKEGKIHVGDLRIEGADGKVTIAKNIEITMSPGSTSKEDLLDALNKQLNGLLDKYLDKD